MASSVENNTKEFTLPSHNLKDLYDEPFINFGLYDLFFLALDYIPQGNSEFSRIYQKYIRVAKSPAEVEVYDANNQSKSESLVTKLDMTIYRSSDMEMVGSMSKKFELTNALPAVNIDDNVRSMEVAGSSQIFSINNIMQEKIYQFVRVRELVSDFGDTSVGYNKVLVTLHQIFPSEAPKLVHHNLHWLDNSDHIVDHIREGHINTDHMLEKWNENEISIVFTCPPVSVRKESLKKETAAK